MMNRYSRLLLMILVWAVPIGGFAADGSSVPAEVLSDMRRRFEMAEAVLDSGNLREGARRLEELLVMCGEHDLDNRTYVDLGTRLAAVWHALEEYDKEQQLLTQLFDAQPPEDLLLRVGILQGRLFYQQEKDVEALEVLTAVDARVPQLQWRSDDRALLYQVRERLNEKYRDIILSAERLFEAGLYQESVSLYIDALTAALGGYFPEAIKQEDGLVPIFAKVRYRLMQALYLAEDYEKAIAIATQKEGLPFFRKSHDLEQLNLNMINVLAHAYRRSGRCHEAIDTFRRFIRLQEKPNSREYFEAHYEIGLAYFELEQFYDSRQHLFAIGDDCKDAQLVVRARLQLAKADMAEGDLETAYSRLVELERLVDRDTDLRFERSYLLGDIAFQRKDYVSAAKEFAAAIPNRNAYRADWVADAYYRLGWSHLKLADQSGIGRPEQVRRFDLAEQAFRLLVDLKGSDPLNQERAHLALGQCYLRRGFRLGEDGSYDMAEKVLNAPGVLASLDAQAQALLLRAEASSLYEVRCELYAKLTSDTYSNTAMFSQGWYLQGLNDFEEGQRLESSGHGQGLALFEQAIPSFQRAFQEFRDTDPERAGLSIKYAAEAYHYLGTPEATRSAYHLTDTLVSKHPDLLAAIPEQGEIFYLRGILASELVDDVVDSERLQKVAELSMLQVISEHPQSAYTEKALQFLGALFFQKGDYLQAQTMYGKLAEDYPNSSTAGDALFWAGECADWLQQPADVIRGFRQRVYEEYPQCAHAAEAYFNYYSYAEYMEGELDAMRHLAGMKRLFPNSPFLVNAYYLIGLDRKHDRKDIDGNIIRHRDLSAAIEAFDQARSTMDYCYSKNLVPDNHGEYFATVRYRAVLDGALTNLAVAKDSTGAKKQIYLEYAQNAFDRILQDLSDPTHAIAQLLRSAESHQSILEESQFGLAQVHIQGKNPEAAEQVLDSLLDQFKQNKITRGYLLSRVWYELGGIATLRGDNELALEYYAHSEDAAKGRVLTAEQRLSLWIEQALCYRRMGQLDNAMTILSKVVNDNAISSLRLKAMYLRAEIYEQQGRQELAIKQLEATSKKGGEWAMQAQEKLINDYGFR